MSKKEVVDKVVLYKHDGKDKTSEQKKEKEFSEQEKEVLYEKWLKSEISDQEKEEEFNEQEKEESLLLRGNKINEISQNKLNKISKNINKKKNKKKSPVDYIYDFKKYIGKQLNLDYKQELMKSLDNSKPYQRCFLFFNDNRKYRQLHELYKVMSASIQSVNNGEVINQTKDVQYPTSEEFCKFATTWRSLCENGFVIYNNRPLKVLTRKDVYKGFLDNAKDIANRIVSSRCLGCTAEPQVKE